MFNSHTHTAPNGPTTPPTTTANQLQRKDYEDEKNKTLMRAIKLNNFEIDVQPKFDAEGKILSGLHLGDTL